MKGARGYKFSNWSKTYGCEPQLYFEPNNVDEIKEILSEARHNNKRVKVFGEGVSPSTINCTPDYMICMRNMKRLLEVNKDLRQVKVESGMLLSDLNDVHLPQHGLAMSVMGLIDFVSVGGMISTGTHGSGKNYGVTSTFVVSVDILTASGDIIEVDKTGENSDLYPAFAVSLGCLGIIVSVTLQCEPAFNLHCSQYPLPLDDVLDNLDVHISSSEHFSFTIFPHVQSVFVKHANRTTKDVCAKNPLFMVTLFWHYLLVVSYWMSTFWPTVLVPLINRIFFNILCSGTSSTVGRSDRVFTVGVGHGDYASEWAVPAETAAWVLRKLRAWYAEEGNYAHFPVLVRFVKADDLYLSPATGRETCYINVLMNQSVSYFILDLGRLID